MRRSEIVADEKTRKRVDRSDFSLRSKIKGPREKGVALIATEGSYDVGLWRHI